MSVESTPSRLTRRCALVGAAWSTPAIVVAAAAPAVAGSPGASLTFEPGQTRVTPSEDPVFYDLEFANAFIAVPIGVDGSQLTVTIAFTPSTIGGPAGLFVLDNVPDSGFTVSPQSGPATSVLMTYTPSVAAGAAVPLPNAIVVGAGESAATQAGSYVVTVMAPGLASASRSFATPPVVAGRPETVRR